MSLRKVNRARIERSGFWFFATHRFYYAKRECFTLSDREYRAALSEITEQGVSRIGEDGDRTLWWSDAGTFWADTDLESDDVDLLIWDRARRQDARLDRLRTIRARDADVETAKRQRIPEEVRAFAWQRDGGQCTGCGAEDDLQFDHVIPVAKGGGNAPDNVQVLCGDCNRAKSDSIV
ncbi:MAG TPA: HNH endonuclease signature motif containing protein [Dehalococcoidia bacterium]|jgi:hypothetical protein|nr:HNH endonuclease signature motif containing protein [Dehalococcoidia bacterium]